MSSDWDCWDELLEECDDLEDALQSGNVIAVCRLAQDVVDRAKTCRNEQV